MTNNDLGSIIYGFIIIIVGIVLLSAIADSIFEVVNPYDVVNESVAITSAKNIVLRENITISSSVGNTVYSAISNLTFFGNVTANTDDNVTINVDVNWTRGGRITVSVNNFTDNTAGYNISYIYDTNGTGQTANNNLTAFTFFGNADTNTEQAAVAINTNVNWTTSGVLTVDTNNFSDANYNASYSHTGDTYVSNSTVRALLPLVNLFFAIAVMISGVLLALKGFRGMGIG